MNDTKLQEPRELKRPHNLSHADSICQGGPRPGVNRHKFTTVDKGPMGKDGTRLERSECRRCRCWYTARVDYGLLMSVFSVPAK
jgi:hypothetical protein